jgi:replicative DNA helicase
VTLASAPALETLPPHDFDSEQALLGALLLDRDAIVAVAHTVSASDFYSAANGYIFAAIQSMMRKRVPVDLVTVQNELNMLGRLDLVGGISYLASLLTAVPTAIHAEYYAETVARLASKRRLIDTATRIVQAAYKPDVDPEEAVSMARQWLAAVTPEAKRGAVVTYADIANELHQEIERRLDPHYEPDVVSTGITDLDRALRGGGLERQQALVLAGRPGSGKTSLGLQIAINYARAQSFGPDPQWTIVFSAEMSRMGLGWRSLSEATTIGARDLNDAISTSQLQNPSKLTDEQFSRMAGQLDDMRTLPILVDDRPAPTTDQMRETVERLQAQYPIRLVVFDYIGLAGDKGKHNANQQDRIAAISAGMMALKKACDVSTITLSQLNRGVESREDKRPRLSDLRDSGAIEQDADIVWGLYRNDYYVEQGMVPDDISLRNVAEVLFLKQRDGTTPIVKIRFNPTSTSFHNLAKGGV